MTLRNASLEEAILAFIAGRLGSVVGGVPALAALAPLDDALAALTAEERHAVPAIVGRIRVGRPADPQDMEPGAEVDAEVFLTCLRAFVRAQPVALLYRDAQGRETERRVEPHGLLVRAPLWYVLGFDRRKDVARRFRLDRVESAHFMIGPRFEPRDPADLFDDLEGVAFDVSA